MSFVRPQVGDPVRICVYEFVDADVDAAAGAVIRVVPAGFAVPVRGGSVRRRTGVDAEGFAVQPIDRREQRIGRASCRERV